MSPALLDPFIPDPDVRERHQVRVRAPAALVDEVAREFDMQSVPLIRGIFWLRTKLLGASEAPAPGAGLVAATRSYGWGVLLDSPGEAYVSGAACQPWLADVVFSAIPPEAFAAYAEPDRVKIAWSIESEALGPARTRLSSETRVVGTDAAARVRFRRYWRLFGAGILMIRWLLLPAVRREAERRWRRSGGSA